jgi:hypothetical protein
VYFQNKTAFDLIFQRTKKNYAWCGFDFGTAASIEHIVTEGFGICGAFGHFVVIKNYLRHIYSSSV